MFDRSIATLDRDLKPGKLDMSVDVIGFNPKSCRRHAFMKLTIVPNPDKVIAARYFGRICVLCGECWGVDDV